MNHHQSILHLCNCNAFCRIIGPDIGKPQFLSVQNQMNNASSSVSSLAFLTFLRLSKLSLKIDFEKKSLIVFRFFFSNRTLSRSLPLIHKQPFLKVHPYESYSMLPISFASTQNYFFVLSTLLKNAFKSTAR